MGMSDNLVLEYSEGALAGLPREGWQTKDGMCVNGTYTITRNGLLWFESKNFLHDVDKHHEPINQPFSFGQCVEGESIECRVCFKHGYLVAVEAVVRTLLPSPSSSGG